MNNKPAVTKLAPLLIVRNARAAIDFYLQAIGAREVACYFDKRNETVSHAELALGEVTISVTEEAPAWNSVAPPSLGGSPVVLQLDVDDVELLLDRLCRAGATALFPITEFCGERMARVRDPFGHIWIIKQRLEELTTAEIQRRRDACIESMIAKSESPAGSSKTSPG